MTQPTGGVWIGEHYYVAVTGEVLAAYRGDKLVEVEVDGKLFVPAPAGTLRCSDCKHTMSRAAWEEHCGLTARFSEECVGIDEDGKCPECEIGTMDEVA